MGPVPALTPRQLKTASFQEQVVTALRTMIIEGQLTPGASLSEVVLAETFGVSRTPVREALKALQVEGLVEIRSRVGTFVASPSLTDLDELFVMKGLLEGAAARLLTERSDAAELRALKENVRSSARAVAAGDVEKYTLLVHKFHDLLIAGADNAKLASHYQILMNQLAYGQLVHASLSLPGRAAQSQSEHEQVMALILEGDGNGAEQLMRTHVHASHRAVMSSLHGVHDGGDPRR